MSYGKRRVLVSSFSLCSSEAERSPVKRRVGISKFPMSAINIKEMPITFVEGNLFDSKAQTIVNPVNCVGVMGKGIALEFKKRYPLMYEEYKEHCKNNLISIGKLWLYKKESPWILNFPTKLDWRNESKIVYLQQGLVKFLDTYRRKGITSISFPLLGTGNGGLPKNQVIYGMKKHLINCDIPVEIYIH